MDTQTRWFAKWDQADEARRLVQCDPWANEIKVERDGNGYKLTWAYALHQPAGYSDYPAPKGWNTVETDSP